MALCSIFSRNYSGVVVLCKFRFPCFLMTTTTTQPTRKSDQWSFKENHIYNTPLCCIELFCLCRRGTRRGRGGGGGRWEAGWNSVIVYETGICSEIVHYGFALCRPAIVKSLISWRRDCGLTVRYNTSTLICLGLEYEAGFSLVYDFHDIDDIISACRVVDLSYFITVLKHCVCNKATDQTLKPTSDLRQQLQQQQQQHHHHHHYHHHHQQQQQQK